MKQIKERVYVSDETATRSVTPRRDARRSVTPTRWCGVRPLQHQEEENKPDYVPEFNSRLVSCGNFADTEGVRTDAPTSDIETHALVAACHGVPLFSSDIKNAYFQAMPFDRTVITARRATRCRPRGLFAHHSTCLRIL